MERVESRCGEVGNGKGRDVERLEMERVQMRRD